MNVIEKKGKTLLLIILVGIILIELLRETIFTNLIDIQPQEVIKKGITLILIIISMYYIFNGFNWAKYLLSMICFYLEVSLFPAAMLQLLSYSISPNSSVCKLTIFILTIGLPSVLYLIMGFTILKSHSITAFMNYQKNKKRID